MKGLFEVLSDNYQVIFIKPQTWRNLVVSRRGAVVMKERRLNIQMSRDMLSDFKKAIQMGEVASVQQQYILVHQDVSYDDVLSLALNQAISHDPAFVGRILSIPHKENILATVDEGGQSPITFLFYGCPYRQEAMDAIRDYLHARREALPKVDLKDKTFIYLHSAMQAALFEYMTVYDNVPYVRENFLDYIYSKNTLDQFESAFVKDFDPGEYLRKGHDAFFRQWGS